MTIDSATPIQLNAIAGTGPYGTLWPYAEGAVTAAVVLADGSLLQLTPVTDFTVAPLSTETAGNITLAAGIATTHAGRQLMLARQTIDEQGWLGNLSAREKGLEAQLDQITMGQQELRAQVARSLRSTTALNPVAPMADGTVLMWEDGQIVPGPNADDLADAEANAAIATTQAGIATSAAAAFKLATIAAMKALTPANGDTAFVTAASGETHYVFRSGNYTAQITAVDPRYHAPNSDPTGATGAWIEKRAVWDGIFSGLSGMVPVRSQGRMFHGEAAAFNGAWSGNFYMTGVPDITEQIHPWIWRDAEALFASQTGAPALVTYARSSLTVNYPGYPTAYPYTSGGWDAFLNDGGTVYHHGAARYMEGTRLAGSGFTVGYEAGMANYGSETAPNPFNVKSGGTVSGVTGWFQAGNGQDRVNPLHHQQRHIAAYGAFLTSFDESFPKVQWLNAYTYPVGAVLCATYGASPYVVLVAHTTPASGDFATFFAANPTYYAVHKTGLYAPGAFNAGDYQTDAVSDCTFRCNEGYTATNPVFSAERNANPTKWRQLPAAVDGLIFGAGALAETGPGSNSFSGFDFQERTTISWWRNKAGTPQQSAFIWADFIPDDSPLVGITLSQNLIDFTASNGIRADAARIGDSTNYTTISRSAGANGSLSITNPGTGVILFYENGGEVARLDTAGINLPAGKVVRINGVQVLGPRDTGWAADTGTAKKTANDTYSGTASAAYVQAEMTAVMNALRDVTQTVKALKDAKISSGQIGA